MDIFLSCPGSSSGHIFSQIVDLSCSQSLQKATDASLISLRIPHPMWPGLLSSFSDRRLKVAALKSLQAHIGAQTP